jgi:hypothetical protein
MATTDLAAGSTAGVVENAMSGEVFEEYVEQSVAANLFTTYEGERRDGSDRVTVPILKMPTGSMETYSEADNETATHDAILMDSNAIILDQFKYKAVQWSGPFDLILGSRFRGRLNKRLGQFVAGAFDTVVFAAAKSCTSQTDVEMVDHSLWTYTNAEIMQLLGNANTQMDVKDIPEMGRFWVMTPYLFQRCTDVFGSSDFGGGLYPWLNGGGVVKTILGYPVVKSNRLPTEVLSGGSGRNSMLCHVDALGTVGGHTVAFVNKEDAVINYNQVKVSHYYGIDSFPDDGTSNYGVVLINHFDS